MAAVHKERQRVGYRIIRGMRVGVGRLPFCTR